MEQRCVQEQVLRFQMERAAAALRENRMDVEIVENPQELLRKIRQLVPQGATTASGGSMTLEETGVMAWLTGGETRYLSGNGSEEARMQAQFCDYYFMSSNAITLNGALYNVDGNGNRVSALIYGPKHVVVVAGANKLVKDLEAAELRIKMTAAPCNSVRLGRNTGCAKTGVCVNCKTDARICCHTVISTYQRHPGRIHVFLLPDSYGF